MSWGIFTSFKPDPEAEKQKREEHERRVASIQALTDAQLTLAAVANLDGGNCIDVDILDEIRRRVGDIGEEDYE